MWTGIATLPPFCVTIVDIQLEAKTNLRTTGKETEFNVLLVMEKKLLSPIVKGCEEISQVKKFNPNLKVNHFYLRDFSRSCLNIFDSIDMRS